MRKTTAMAAFAASVLMGTMAVVPMQASAATVYTAASGTTTTFCKYLELDAAATVPNATFTFAIAPGEAIAADPESGTLAVLAGIGTPTIADVSFTAQDPKTADSTDATKATAVRKATVDFTQVSFPEPGVYRYLITESGENQGITNDATATRTLDVYLADEGGTLQVAGYVLYKGTITDAPKASSADAAAGTKSEGFTNTYTTHDLTFCKEVAGNQASRDKYFAFTVQLEHAVAGTVYTVDLTQADAVTERNAATLDAYEGKSNPTTLTAGADGTVTGTFYLQHGQQIRIQGVAEDTQYTITELPEDYTPSAAVSGDTEGITNTSDSVSDSSISADTTITFTNTRTGIIPTGVLFSVAAPTAGALLAGGGMLALLLKRRKRSASDEA